MKYLSVLLLSGIILGIISCDQQPSASNASEKTAPVVKEDQLFLLSVFSTGMYEAKLAQLALNKSHDTSIWAFATSVKKDLSRVSDKAKLASMSRNISLPYFLSHQQNEGIKRLSGMTGEDFEKEFVQQIRDDQERLIKTCNDFTLSGTTSPDLVEMIAFCKETSSAHQAMMDRMNLTQ
jgi:putative membrane protein